MFVTDVSNITNVLFLAVDTIIQLELQNPGSATTQLYYHSHYMLMLYMEVYLFFEQTW